MTPTRDEYFEARQILLRRVFGSRATDVVSLFIQLGLPEAIGEQDATVNHVSNAVGLSIRQLRRLLQSADVFGLCHLDGERASLTPAGRLLLPGASEGMREFAEFHTHPRVLQSWRHLRQALKDEISGYELEYGRPLYDDLSEHPRLLETFNSAMSQESAHVAGAVSAAWDFSNAAVIDVGGGDGTLLSQILHDHPSSTGVVLESPDVIGSLPPSTSRSLRFLPRDFFQPLDVHGDVFVVKNVLHNWRDEEAEQILRNIADACPPDGRVLVVDVLIPEVVDGPSKKQNLFMKDLQMLVLVGGRERTRAEWAHLGRRAGLTLTKVHDVNDPGTGVSMIEFERYAREERS